MAVTNSTSIIHGVILFTSFHIMACFRTPQLSIAISIRQVYTEDYFPQVTIAPILC